MVMLMFLGIFVVGEIVRIVINIKNGVFFLIVGIMYVIFVLIVLLVFVLYVLYVVFVSFVLVLMVVVWNISKKE